MSSWDVDKCLLALGTYQVLLGKKRCKILSTKYWVPLFLPFYLLCSQPLSAGMEDVETHLILPRCGYNYYHLHFIPEENEARSPPTVW
jgi:hypothetical protein